MRVPHSLPVAKVEWSSYWEGMELITNKDTLRWLELTADVLHENRVYLTDLDSAIGDADHGINMDRGFSAVRAKFPTMVDMDIATQLSTVGMTLVSTVGGASGPLYGTAYLRAAAAAAGKQELGPADIVSVLEAFLTGIITRGKAQAGEKTMIDALTPAVAAARQALDQGATIAQITSQAYSRRRSGHEGDHSYACHQRARQLPGGAQYRSSRPWLDIELAHPPHSR